MIPRTAPEPPELPTNVWGHAARSRANGPPRVHGRRTSPAWLDAAVGDARFDARVPLRVAAWQVAAERAEWFDPASARHALHDESARVRMAAIHAWRKAGAALPRAELRRLLADEMAGVRLALVRLLEDVPADDAAQALLRGHDAWVRGNARKRLAAR